VMRFFEPVAGLAGPRALHPLVLLFLLLAAPQSIAGPPDDSASPIGTLDAEIRCPHGGRPATDGASTDDRPCVDEFRGSVVRTGDILTFKLDGGKTKVLESNSKACQEVPVGACVIYELVGFIPGSRQFVVLQSLYESAFVELVSARTGIVTHLEGYPRLSPKRGQFVTVAASDAWDIKSPIAIYSNTDPPKLLWRFPEPPEYEQYSFAGWDGEDRVKLRTISNPQIETDVTRTADGWLLRRPNGKVSSGTALPPAPTQRP
jgi:hypothetical protein